MLRYRPELPLVSVHVPKCAGSSFREVLARWFGERLQFHYQHVEFNAREVWERASFEGGWCVHGHFHEAGWFTGFDHYPDARQLITWLRDPLDVNVSFFHYGRDRYLNHGMQVVSDRSLEKMLHAELDEWLVAGRSLLLYSMPRWMDASNYKDVVDEFFVHVGVVEEMETSMGLMAERLGKPVVRMPFVNETPRSSEVSWWARERFREQNSLAYRLYDYAREVNRSRAGAA